MHAGSLRRWIGLALLVLATLLHFGAATAAASDGTEKRDGRRLALVIGNGGYQAHPLKNAVNDARLIAKRLGEVGFEVMQGTNLTQRQMYRMIDDFREQARHADVALIYYAGHGVQVRGANYLIPVELMPKDEFDITSRSVSLDRVIEMFDTDRGRVNVVVIDACRDNPFGSSRSLGPKGLAEVQSRPGTFIAYSTAPGSTATDSDAPGGRNSIYSYALANAIIAPALSVEDAFKNVRREVLRATGGRQTPWEATSLVVPFSFNPAGTTTYHGNPGADAASGPTRANSSRSLPEATADPLPDLAPEEARQELVKLGIAWTDAAFAASIREGDDTATRLFLQSGKSVFSMTEREAVLGYLACGNARADMVRTLRRQGVDLGRPYDRRYRIEGVTIMEKTQLLHEWLSRCPDNDVEFARALVEAGVKWPANVPLKNHYSEDWVRGVLRAPESAKILIRAGAIDPAIDNYLIYRELNEPAYRIHDVDAELAKLVAPKDIAAFKQQISRQQQELPPSGE